jgi:hypothetical protein
MSKKKPSTIARENLDTIETAVTAHEESERKLSEEVAALQREADAGDLGYDALRHIQAEAELRAERLWLEVQRPHLVEARKVHESFVQSEAVATVLALHAAVPAAKAETVAKIREALDEYREAVSAYNSELTEHIGAARKAGLIEGEADPTLPVLMGGGEYGHPRRLVIDGEHFVTVTVNTDSIIQEARR